MKKCNINKICEIFKFIFINLIVYGIIMGVLKRNVTISPQITPIIIP